MMNPVKDKVQREAVEALTENEGGLIAIATGGGKSKIAIDYSLQVQRNKADLKILVIVPTRALRDTDWKNEFYKWGATDLWTNNVRKECYAYIEKIAGETFDIVIMDEVQHITPNNYKFFVQNEIGKIVALSATPPKEKEKKELLELLSVEPVYQVGLDKGVQIGLVAPYTLTLVESNLNSSVNYVKAGSKAKPFMSTESRQYMYLTDTISKMRYRGANNQQMKWMYLKRMRFIYDLQSKERVAKYLLDKVIPKDERTLIFTGGIKMAEALEPNSYHSKRNDECLIQFRNKEINRLSCVEALNEGVNIPEVDNALIVQANSNERNLIQRIGRILRFEEGHVGHIYLQYVKGTVDEKWMEKAIEGLNKNQIKLLKMNV